MLELKVCTATAQFKNLIPIGSNLSVAFSFIPSETNAYENIFLFLTETGFLCVTALAVLELTL